MCKNIIPDLVSFETTLNKLSGFYFSDNFQFYPQIETKSTFHYKVFIDDNIAIPKQYDFRNGYFLKFKNKWYYERKIGIFTLKFCFDPQNKVFSFNKLYSLVPFEIGHIFPVGRHIADIINLDLFLGDLVTLNGSALVYEGSTYCIVSPSFNGKTTLISNLLSKSNSKYIAEDILIIDLSKMTVYPTSFRTDFFVARKTNKQLRRNFSNEKVETRNCKINNLFLFYNSINSDYLGAEKNFCEFFDLLGTNFLRNYFIKAIIFFENLTSVVDSKRSRISELKSKVNYNFFSIDNFNFKFFDQKYKQ